MSTPAPHDRLELSSAEQAWEQLSKHVDTLIEAWDRGEVPDLAQFLPSGPPALRRLTLVELIKVDLEFRWGTHQLPKRIEEYALEFPELEARGGVPADLIYEEYHVRRQSGEEVDCHEYFERFPQQAEELGRLLGLEAPHLTTALFSPERLDEIQAGDRLDDFDLLTQLGRGAFATVFLARQCSMQRLVALKVSADRGVEPQTLAQLDHPHIVRVYDQRILAERKLRLLYMQYVAGGTLQAVIEYMRRLPLSQRSGRTLLEVVDACLERRGESPPIESPTRNALAAASWPEIVCWVGVRLASALAYAHDRGVLHRDVKPANVLVSAEGAPKLVDFNVSTSSKLDGASPSAYFGGSLAYMSPEHLEACNPRHPSGPEDLDAARCDVYSLGVLLWEMLVGQRPFADEQLADGWAATLEEMTARRRAGVDIARLAPLPPRMPAGLVDVLRQALAVRPEDRFQSAGEMARQLELCLKPDVQRLMRPRPGSLRDFVRRRPLLPLLLAGVLPNAIASGLNIVYNLLDIIQRMGDQAREVFLDRLLVTVNVVAYSVGIALCLFCALPVLRGISQLNRGRPPTPERAARLRRHALKLGDYIAGISMTEWIISGVAFPLALRAQFDASGYVQFMISQVMCGLMASSIAFFLVTFICVRNLYTRLILPEPQGGSDAAALARLHLRTWFYFGATVVVPFVGVIALVLFRTSLQAAFVVLSLMGVVIFGCALALTRAIQRDVSTLHNAALPGGESFGTSSTGLESFWTRSG